MRLFRKLFSKSNKKDKDDYKDLKSTGKKLGILSTATSITNAGMLISTVGKQKSSDRNNIAEKLEKIAEKQGTDIVTSVPKNKIMQNAYYLSESSKPAARKRFAKYLKKQKYKNNVPNSKLMDSLKSCKKLSKKTGDAIFIEKQSKDNLGDHVATLAHELGHSQYVRKEGSGGKIGKAAHKVYVNRPGIFIIKNGKTISFVNGIHSGIKAEKAKQEGKKESKWNRAKSIAVPLAITAPMLVSEAAASKKGIELLKNSGASKELLKESKKRLAEAYGTYLTKAGNDVISGEIGRVVGRTVARKKYNKAKKDKKED